MLRMLKRRNDSKPLIRTLLLTFAGLFFTVIFMIVLFSYSANIDEIENIAGVLFNKTFDNAQNEIVYFMSPIRNALNFNAGVFSRGILNIHDIQHTISTDISDMEHYLLDVLDFYPQFYWVCLTDKHGYMLGPERIAPDIIRIHFTTPPDSGRDNYYKDIDIYRNVVDVTVNPPALRDYDPRLRQWYRDGIDAPGLHWTDMYLYVKEETSLGITAIKKIYDDAKGISGVFTVDIELHHLMEFISGISFGETGFAMLLNRAGKIIAGGGQVYEFIQQVDNTDLQTRHIGNTALSWLAEAWKRYEQDGSLESVVNRDGVDYKVAFSSLNTEGLPEWTVALVIPKHELTGDFVKSLQITFLVATAIFILSALAVYFISRLISKPLNKLRIEANKLDKIREDKGLDVNSPIKEIHDLTTEMLKLKAGLSSFNRYVPDNIVRRLIESGAGTEIGGEKRRITALFSDIEGFTTISEKMPPEYLTLHLSEYFNVVSSIIVENGGTIDRYVGDAVRAFWGAPERLDNHAELACRAALKCRIAIKELNRRWISENKPALNTRIGLYTGDSFVGMSGSADRINYTAVGESVSGAVDMEGMNKRYGSAIIMNSAAREEAGNLVVVRPLPQISRGIKDGSVNQAEKCVTLAGYELLCMREEADLNAVSLNADFNQAFEKMKSCSYQDALELFMLLEQEMPEDQVIRKMIEMCNILKSEHSSDNDSGNGTM